MGHLSGQAVIAQIKGCEDVGVIQERGRGQFLQACEAKALQERLGCRKAEPPVGTGKFLDKLEIAEFHDEAALIGVEEAVDFRLANRLLKGDAGEHFEGRGREI